MEHTQDTVTEISRTKCTMKNNIRHTTRATTLHCFLNLFTYSQLVLHLKLSHVYQCYHHQYNVNKVYYIQQLCIHHQQN